MQLGQWPIVLALIQGPVNADLAVPCARVLEYCAQPYWPGTVYQYTNFLIDDTRARKSANEEREEQAGGLDVGSANMASRSQVCSVDDDEYVKGNVVFA
ncbi:hypothetical protein IAQ61_005682 [Plenodomus lingam]|uniref:uncharacterized protein n=1 Tax=Leptosphaeria maculans TaxID=5022 RepID=UPI00332130DE|nr:hypothetical protein IAQ61_005682 [Plenodomus lingam]